MQRYNATAPGAESPVRSGRKDKCSRHAPRPTGQTRPRAPPAPPAPQHRRPPAAYRPHVYLGNGALGPALCATPDSKISLWVMAATKRSSAAQSVARSPLAAVRHAAPRPQRTEVFAHMRHVETCGRALRRNAYASCKQIQQRFWILVSCLMTSLSAGRMPRRPARGQRTTMRCRAGRPQ